MNCPFNLPVLKRGKSFPLKMYKARNFGLNGTKFNFPVYTFFNFLQRGLAQIFTAQGVGGSGRVEVLCPFPFKINR